MPKHRIGRPSPIDAQIERPGGDHTTVADLIVQLMKVGCYFETACAAASIHRDTGHEWLKVAGRVRIRAKGQTLATLEMTDHERRCLSFSDAILQVTAEWESQANAQLERLGRGGIKAEIVTEKRDADGNLVEKTTRTEMLVPDKQVLEWRLTRRFPHRYGDRIEVASDLSAPSEEEHASDLVASIEAWREGHEQGRADAQAEAPGG